MQSMSESSLPSSRAPGQSSPDITLPAAPLTGRKIALGVTGGIAAYKAAQLVRDLQRAGADVQVVMTRAATTFVGPATFQALSGKAVYTDTFDERLGDGMAHIDLGRQVDAILVAPATADFLAKLTHGHCDDLLTTLCAARDVPLLLAPAMNRQMWQNPANQRNIAQLQADGIEILGPGAGEQACGEVGDGRMLEPLDLVEALTAFFSPKVLQGKRVLLTAGPTYEAIDPVRGITNLSSGKMGYALARACAHAGAEVTLVSGPTAQTPPPGVRLIPVNSALQMLAAVESVLDEHRAQDARDMPDAPDMLGSIEQRPTGSASPASPVLPPAQAQRQTASSIDCFIAVAAVADWRPATAADQKLKKHASADSLAADIPAIPMVENPDILATVARRLDAPFCVGFAAESHDLIRHATEKRQRKGIPLLVANQAPAAFHGDENELLLVDEKGARFLPRGSKTALAQQLVQEIAQRLAANATPTR
ncbi:MAG: bifunctional phosphopantothenoylcysteine decarboxylase/phosphopantothenate--cysteine ligase CoaBC [Lautropia sp.]|nr:bifunctional phosphopantothenoylcysteine decarboxylase/phosphopantothenate--cysteine ligase CoaBC [Lautropia sp.]